LPNEDQKLDSLCPGSREIEKRGSWEGQNFQQLREVQHLEKEEEDDDDEATATEDFEFHISSL
jgi:hypothetical protein